jgi:uncharacterized protein (TIGR02231 family)
MKNMILVASLLLACFQSFAQDTIYCKPEIKEVTIFNSKLPYRDDETESTPGGAQLKLQTEVELKKGMNIIVFKDLPNGINHQLFAEPDFEIISTKFQEIKELDKKKITEKIKDLEKRKSILFKEIDNLKNQISALTQEKEMISANKTQNSNSQEDIVETMKKVGEYYRVRIVEIGSAIFDADAAVSKKLDEVNALNALIANIEATKEETVNQLVAFVLSQNDAKRIFTVELFEKTATWDVLYDLKVKNVKTPVDLSYKAKISQQSGINWKNVKVILSSNQPKQSATSPILKTWNLDFTEKFLTLSIRVEDVQTDQEIYKTQISENIINKTINFSYELPQLMTIPSSSEAFTIEITNFQIPAMFEYVCIPKKDKDVFLTAKITDWEKYNLLTGPISLYLVGTYVGESEFKSGRVTDTLEFSLGRDRGIIVECTRSTEYSKKQFLSSKRTENVGWDISIRNNKRTDIELVLKDQLPVPVRKEIEVEQVDISGAELEKVTGLLQWKVQLKPAETKKLMLKYNLTYPKDKKVVID